MILLVEDEAISRRVLAYFLSLGGYRVMTAADGRQAVELLDRHPFDLVITDLGLPKVSGFELIKHVRVKSPQIPIIVVSAQLHAAEVLRGEAEFFPKPVAPDAVLAAVKRLAPRLVRLRDHALIRNWPPIWTNFTKPVTDRVRREIGVLRRVRFNSVVPHQCFLLIDHENEFFTGALIFNDTNFCCQITDMLRRHVGRSIREIGDLDLSHTH